MLKDPDSNPYSLLDTSEPEPPVDSEPGEPPPASARRRRSRRRRTDEDRTVMDGGLESDGPNMTENGLGEGRAWVLIGGVRKNEEDGCMTFLYYTEDESRPQRRNRSRRRRNRGNRTDGSISGDRQPGQLTLWDWSLSGTKNGMPPALGKPGLGSVRTMEMDTCVPESLDPLCLS